MTEPLNIYKIFMQAHDKINKHMNKKEQLEKIFDEQGLKWVGPRERVIDIILVAFDQPQNTSKLKKIVEVLSIHYPESTETKMRSVAGQIKKSFKDEPQEEIEEMEDIKNSNLTIEEKQVIQNSIEEYAKLLIKISNKIKYT